MGTKADSDLEEALSTEESEGIEEDNNEDEEEKSFHGKAVNNEDDEEKIFSRNTFHIKNRLDRYKKDCQVLINFLKTGTVTPSLGKEKNRHIRRNRAKTHVWDEKENKLYYIGGKKGIRKLVLYDMAEIDNLIAQVHVKSDGTHMGVNSTLAALTSKYVWASMKLYIKSYVASCHFCQSKQFSHGKHPAEFVKVDMLAEEAEFSYEATIMIIKAMKRCYRNLSGRQIKPHMMKEVQEELAHHGYSYTLGAIRQKWIDLLEMQKRMKRELYQKNPPWQFYLMLEDIDKGDTDPTVLNSINNYQHQDPISSAHHASNYTDNNSQGDLHAAHLSHSHLNYPVQPHDIHQGHALEAQAIHQNSDAMAMLHAAALVKADPGLSEFQKTQAHDIQQPSSAPVQVMHPSTAHNFSACTSSDSKIKKDAKKTGVQQNRTHKLVKKKIQCIKVHSDRRSDRMDRLQVKHLRKIGNELQTIAAVLPQILQKQDQMLSAITGQMQCR